MITWIHSQLRTLLVLGRVSNLPTVWSNCLAGWLLGGGGEVSHLLWVALGGTWLYLGGAFLNDAFDVQWDAQHRPERPIPSRQITVETVWKWALVWLALGLICFVSLGRLTGLLALLLSLNLLIYDAVHKIFVFAPVFMAACRLFLLLAAASTGQEGVTGLSVWSALVLAAYVFGLSYLARKESIKTRVRYWPCIFLAAPVVLALIVNQGEAQLRAALLCCVLVLWALFSLRYTFWSAQRHIGRTVSGLLAGIALVDLVAMAGGTGFVGLAFAVLFLLALVLQPIVPAT